MQVKIEESWKKILQDEFDKKYFLDLTDFVKKEYKERKIFPPPKNIFESFNLCPFDSVKVVILGQDPYHGKGQANGLAFAVNNGVALPPSLLNIFKEIENDLGYKPEMNGDLSRYARQGVLLLNATLTVQNGMAGSHQGRGWEEFTDKVVEKLCEKKDGLVFMFWGNYAKKKGEKIDRRKHLVLESTHPSPFSAYNGFFGCRHFSKTNKYLKSKGEREIDWR